PGLAERAATGSLQRTGPRTSPSHRKGLDVVAIASERTISCIWSSITSASWEVATRIPTIWRAVAPGSPLSASRTEAGSNGCTSRFQSSTVARLLITTGRPSRDDVDAEHFHDRALRLALLVRFERLGDGSVQG